MTPGSKSILVTLLIALMTPSALAHTSATGQDYSKYRRKNGASCCNEKDCRPTRYQREADGSITMYPDGQSVNVPRHLINPLPSDDGNAHWCGKIYDDQHHLTFCAILPEQVVEVPDRASRRQWAQIETRGAD